MTYSAIVIDDYRTNIEYVEALLKAYCPDISVTATATNVDDGIAAIKKHQPQILFLDIELHDKTGFDILNEIDDEHLQVILISAHEKYNFRAFKYLVVDYLLKPIDITELIAAVKRAKANIHNLQAGKAVKKDPVIVDDFITVVQKDLIEIFRWHDIIHLEALRSYTAIYTKSKGRIISSKPLKDYEKTLPGHTFLRVHKSHIVNKNFVVKFIKKGFGILQLSNEKQIPVSLLRRQQVMKIFKI